MRKATSVELEASSFFEQDLQESANSISDCLNELYNAAASRHIDVQPPHVTDAAVRNCELVMMCTCTCSSSKTIIRVRTEKPIRIGFVGESPMGERVKANKFSPACRHSTCMQGCTPLVLHLVLVLGELQPLITCAKASCWKAPT